MESAVRLQKTWDSLSHSSHLQAFTREHLKGFPPPTLYSLVVDLAHFIHPGEVPTCWPVSLLTVHGLWLCNQAPDPHHREAHLVSCSTGSVAAWARVTSMSSFEPK